MCLCVYMSRDVCAFTMYAAGPLSHPSIELSYGGGGKVGVVRLEQLDPSYPALTLFRDGCFGMQLFLNGKRRFISAIGTWEIKAYSGNDALNRVKFTGKSNSVLGMHGERSNLLIFNSEPLFSNAVDAFGSSRPVLDAINRLPLSFGTALAKGCVTHESLLALLYASDSSFVRKNSFVTRDCVSFCSCTASELDGGAGVWLFRLFRFEIVLVGEG